MKKIVMFFVCMLFAYYADAQVMSAKATWVTIKSNNLKCWPCQQALERYLTVENKSNFESGILQWKINLLQGEIRLQYLPDRVTADQIKEAITGAGFDADELKADSVAYKSIPPICKRAEDGGGPQKGKPCHYPNN